jgi:hypothetical protein
MMAWNPVSPVRLNPFAMFVVVAVNPDFFAWMGGLGVYINGREHGQKCQADTQNQYFHSQLLLALLLMQLQ